MRTSPARIAALAAAALLASLTPGLLSGSAGAAVIGTLAFSPASGDSDTNITVVTSAGCPETATNVIVLVTGGDPATPSSQAIDQVVVGNSAISAYAKNGSGGIVIPLTLSMRDLAQSGGFTPIKGSYGYTVRCRTSGDPTSLGDYTSPLSWTPGVGAFDATYVATQATTTSLDVTPGGSQVKGTAITLTATVSPADATGSVQFKDGSTALGAPVAVTAGEASTATSSLAPSGHSLTAVFTPTDAVAYADSTSDPVALTITYPAPTYKPVVFGAVQLGGKPACVAAFDNATAVTYQWLRDGADIAAATASTYAIPESAFNHLISCRVSASNPDNAPLVTTSSAVKVAAGPALRATTAPTLYGSVRRGQRLYVRAGVWSPAATAYTYQWLRDGRVLPGVTQTSRVIQPADVGHVMAVVVTAKRTNWASGRATTRGLRATP